MNRDQILTFLTDQVHFGFPNGFILYTKRKIKKGETKLKLKQLPHPIFLRCGTSDFDTFDQVFKSKELNFNSLMKKPVKSIIDAGANTGFTSIYLTMAYPEAKILAIEPENENFALLVKNTKPYPNITPVHGALWPVRTKVNIQDNDKGNWGFSVSESLPGQEVNAFPVDELMQLHNMDQIDLFKIDIEGHEADLFNGNIEWLKKVKAIAIELHDNMRKGTSKAFLSSVLPDDFSIYIKGEKILAIRD